MEILGRSQHNVFATMLGAHFPPVLNVSDLLSACRLHPVTFPFMQLFTYGRDSNPRCLGRLSLQQFDQLWYRNEFFSLLLAATTLAKRKVKIISGPSKRGNTMSEFQHRFLSGCLQSSQQLPSVCPAFHGISQ